jgi:hypothetical protein
MASIRERGTICGLCGGYGAANGETHEPVPCIACGKKSEGQILIALDTPDDLPPLSQHLGLYLVQGSADASRESHHPEEDD